MRVNLEYRVSGFDEPIAEASTEFNEEGTYFRYVASWYHSKSGERIRTTGDKWFRVGCPVDEQLAGRRAQYLVEHLNRVARSINEIAVAILAGASA